MPRFKIVLEIDAPTEQNAAFYSGILEGAIREELKKSNPYRIKTNSLQLQAVIDVIRMDSE